MVTFGVSTERGTVHAVALSDDDGKLPDRLLIRRTFHIGDAKSDLVPAIEAALEALADEIGPDHEIAGAAVTYRDQTERRAVVTGLASGPWRTVSLVSAKSAHLALAGAMPWTAEFDHLLVCEAVPGYQCFSLISPERDRVLASIAATGATVTAATMRPAVTAAWNQFDVAGAQPEAVMLIGSAASKPVVAATLTSGFGVPVIRSKVASAAAAAGAALAVQPESVDLFALERSRLSRGAAALVAAASVLAGGLVVGGVYEATTSSRTTTAPVLADAHAPAQAHRMRSVEQAPQPEADAGPSTRSPAEGKRAGRAGSSDGAIDPASMLWGPDGGRRMGLRSDSGHSDGPNLSPADPAPGAPSSTAPDPTAPVGAPNQSLLFPGEAAPPQLGTTEFARWWDNHWRMMTEWAEEIMPRA